MAEIATEIEIRPFRPEDVPGRIALLRETNPGIVATPRGFLYSLENESPRARTRLWSAVAGGAVVGAAMARFAHSKERDDLGYLWVGVKAERRGKGLGARLYELVDEYLAHEGARKLETWVVESEAGRRFVERRGFAATRSAQFWSLDPRTADAGDLPRLAHERAAEGFRLVPLREVHARERELHALFVEVVADVPDDEPATNIPFEEWRRSSLAHPDLSLEGSFVALHASDRSRSRGSGSTSRAGKGRTG
jgi:GNAT superfamily N-acetyltransferase